MEGHVDVLAGGGACGALMRAKAWSASVIGEPAAWPVALRTTVGLLLNSKFPMFVAWGSDLTFLYNDAYAEILGDKHPAAMGAAFKDIWSEIWDDIAPLVDKAMAGEASFRDDLPLVTNRRGYDETAWFTFSYSPVRDDTGGVGGMFCAVAETTERVLAQRRQAAEAERQRQMFEQAPGLICILRGADHVIEYANAQHRAVFGRDDAIGKPVAVAYPETSPALLAILDQVYQTGERHVAKAASIRGAGSAAIGEWIIDLVVAPIIDDAGRPSGLFCEGIEITEAHRARQAVLESEGRFKSIADAAPVLIWVADTSKSCSWFNAPWLAFTGRTLDQEVGAGWTQGVHPDDLADCLRIYEEAFDARRPFRMDYRLRRADGAWRIIDDTGVPRFAPDGGFLGYIGSCTDVTEHREAESRLKLMVNELNHRVKNSLATVQAIAAQTLRRDDVPADVREALTARILALSKAHDVINRQRWSGARLGEIAEQATSPYRGDDDGDRISIAGPEVTLQPKAAIALALALHELATNAVKYGALSAPSGRVQLVWNTTSHAEGERLRVTWREEGGPPVAPSATGGFGTRLLTRAIASDLRGTVDIDFAPSGVVCSIEAAFPGDAGDRDDDTPAWWSLDLTDSRAA